MRALSRVELGIAAVGLMAGALFGGTAAAADRGIAGAGRSGAGTSTPTPVAARAEARLAAVRIDDDECGGRRSGTGVAIGHGLVLTARHVVDGDTAARVTGVDGTGSAWGVLGSTSSDLATLTTGAALHPLERAGGDPAVGTTVVVAGAPGGGAMEVRDARVTGYLRGRGPDDPPTVMQLDVPARPGDSGGPVLDGRGRLVGVVYSRDAVDGSALVIPVSVVDRALGTLEPMPPARC